MSEKKNNKEKKMLVLYSNRHTNKTGGLRYEAQLFQSISSISGIDVDIHYGDAIKQIRGAQIFRNIKNISLISKAKGYDVLFFNSREFGVWLFLIAVMRIFFPKKQIIVIHHHFCYMEMQGRGRVYNYLLELLILNLSTRVLVPSPYIMDLMKSKLPNKSVSFVPIPFDKIIDSTPAPQKGKLLYVGTVYKRKGLIYLINSLKYLKPDEYQLTIVGNLSDQNYLNEIEAIIKRHNLNVIFSGHISEQEKNNLFSTSDIFVFPSLLEGYGIAVIEANGYGLPVVCFNNSSLPYLIKDGVNGFLVETKNELEFAHKISSLIKDRELRTTMSKNALLKYKAEPTLEDFNTAIKSMLSTL